METQARATKYRCTYCGRAYDVRPWINDVRSWALHLADGTFVGVGRSLKTVGLLIEDFARKSGDLRKAVDTHGGWPSPPVLEAG